MVGSMRKNFVVYEAFSMLDQDVICKCNRQSHKKRLNEVHLQSV